ncbi:MAG: DUF1015 domain-containing protein [Elusimicrobia bacterium]|nr:DUF1015 domain-containing protein [Candidatus Obscuribacterium magneticum]
MVDIAPFRALRFNPGRKSADISGFICPPYDIISPAQKEKLKSKAPHNVVRIELPDGFEGEKYQNAAKILERWKGEGILSPDRVPSFYLLETTYRIGDPFAPKKIQKRYGVLVALRLETPGKGSVKPHEKTLPKAKEDRLNLLKAVRTNVSPIFGLFFDPRKNWNKWVSKATKTSWLVKGSEEKNLSHKLWKIEQPARTQELQALLRSKPLYIADGHHRYEVAWAYQEYRLEIDPGAILKEGWHRVMTYICPIEESGLLMLPTHRLVKSDLSFKDWSQRLSTLFNLRKMTSVDQLVMALASPKKGKRIIGWVAAEGNYLLELKPDIHLRRCLPERHESLRDLDVVVLHDLVLGEAKEIIFTRDIKEIKAKTKGPESWVGFILSSPGVAAMARVAESGNVMPPKTTYFYPKVPTGFTLMPLDQNFL